MMRSSWPLTLFLCCEPLRVYTLSEKEKSERGGDRGSMVRLRSVGRQGEEPTYRDVLISVSNIQLLNVPMGGS